MYVQPRSCWCMSWAARSGGATSYEKGALREMGPYAPLDALLSKLDHPLISSWLQLLPFLHLQLRSYNTSLSYLPPVSKVNFDVNSFKTNSHHTHEEATLVEMVVSAPGRSLSYMLVKVLSVFFPGGRPQTHLLVVVGQG